MDPGMGHVSIGLHLETTPIAVEKAFKDPEVVDRAVKGGFTLEFKGPEEFRKFIESEIKVADQVAKDANLKKK